ncbi:MAG TPA: hypothetical protein VEP90_00115 [Methylomirabilota bacterium]|nr:hypothetical protein [Methylomirabilota bacterium]
MDNHFVVGQKVVCIEDDWNIYYEERVSFPKKGNIYTIRSMEMIYDESLGLTFVEIVNPVEIYDDGFGEAVFAAYCFRPVKETSIDVFNAILKKVPTRELV